MRRFVNRGFVTTLIIILLSAEVLLRVAASASPPTVRIVYGTTLAMYMEIEKRLRAVAPDVQVLAMGDSLAMTQFQPDVFAADHRLPPRGVFNAAYLAQTFRSQEGLLRHIGIERFPRLRRVLLFVNPRRLTPEGNVDAAVFRVVVPDPDGTWRSAWREKSVAPIFDRSRVYGLSRYLISASWRQIGRATSWDEVEFLAPHGGIWFEESGPAGEISYLYDRLELISERYVADLKRVVDLFRERDINVVLLPSTHRLSAQPFVDPSGEAHFIERMQQLATETGSEWIWLPPEAFRPPAETDFLDYGHLNREGGIAFTHWLGDAISTP